MRACFPFVVSIALCSVVAQAQTAESPTTREEALRKQREAKAAALRPNKPDKVQQALTAIEERGLFLTARDGFHPKIGNLTTGSGFALGVGYRNRAIFNRYGALDTFGAVSLRKYWALEARTIFPDLARGRISAETVASLREYPSEHFYGLGRDARREDNSSFLLRTARVGGRAAVRIFPLLSVGGGVDYLQPRVGIGRASGIPTTQQLFGASNLTGLFQRADFLRSSIFAEFDYRQPKNARQGGYYRVERSHYDDRSTGTLTFNRTDVDLRQYIGFLSGRRVIALRGVVSTTDSAGCGTTCQEVGRGVPFYFMPYLGGKDSLRGFRNYRFRGPHSLLLQGEYRWEIWSGLEGALFYDTGKVALDRDDLNLKQLDRAYGFGFRFNTDNAVIMRFDAAFGSRDGKRLHMIMGGVF